MSHGRRLFIFFSRGRRHERRRNKRTKGTERENHRAWCAGKFPSAAASGLRRRYGSILTRLMRSPSSSSSLCRADVKNAQWKADFSPRTRTRRTPALTHSLVPQFSRSEKSLDSARFPNKTGCAGRNALILLRTLQGVTTSAMP